MESKKDLIDKLRGRGFPDDIVDAFKKVPRENFMPQNFQEYAYEDFAYPIGKGQTISQPHTIAFMLEKLNLLVYQKILEVGSGSGYVLALMAELSKGSEIYGIERIKYLADKSRIVLRKYKDIKVIHADGTKGLPEKAPFDRILVSAASYEIPQTLIDQLNEGGKIVMPVGNSIISLKKNKKGNEIAKERGFTFVPLLEGKD
ncbi:protein-L-isoaspartate(D-aspartate) O-methyltransferase [Nanoarchaeota archaeon]